MAETKRRRPDQLPGGRHGLAPEYVARSQRQRLLDAMIQAVAEQGYQATPVTHVIARAGVSGKTFYEQFADKEECFLAAYDYASSHLLSETNEAYERAASPWPERVHHGVRALLEHLAERPAAGKVCIVEVLAAGRRAIARRDAAIRSFTYFIDAGRGEATHELPGFTAMAILGGVTEILYSNIVQGNTAQLPRLAPDFVYWITLPFLGMERAAEERERSREALGTAVAGLATVPATPSWGSGDRAGRFTPGLEA
jgi:AcrR family transcriptional regulator